MSTRRWSMNCCDDVSGSCEPALSSRRGINGERAPRIILSAERALQITIPVPRTRHPPNGGGQSPSSDVRSLTPFAFERFEDAQRAAAFLRQRPRRAEPVRNGAPWPRYLPRAPHAARPGGNHRSHPSPTSPPPRPSTKSCGIVISGFAVAKPRPILPSWVGRCFSPARRATRPHRTTLRLPSGVRGTPPPARRAPA